MTACGPATVLLVDDDAGMVETLGDILTARGHQVDTARSGAAAISMTERGAYDVVLMDIQMPGLNGVQALRAMKTRDPSALVIMMTAYTRDEMVAEAEQAAGLPVLPKPLDVDRILALMATLTCRSKTSGGGW
jgi:two-component system, response regulator RegA